MCIWRFQIPVVGLDVRSMNEVCNLTALYKKYYNLKNFAKYDDISVILEISVILYL